METGQVKSLLMVEDDENFRTTLAEEFEERNYLVYPVASIQEYRKISHIAFQFAIVDLKLQASSGLDVIEEILKNSDQCRILVLTGYGSIATAVKAVKLGAVNYILKPASILQIERAMVDNDNNAPLNTLESQENPSLAKLEREYIEHILYECGGNISKAAKRLGLYRQSLQRKIKKFPPKT